MAFFVVGASPGDHHRSAGLAERMVIPIFNHSVVVILLMPISTDEPWLLLFNTIGIYGIAAGDGLLIK